MPPSLPTPDSCPFESWDDALGLTPIASDYLQKAVPAATSATTWSLCSASPSTAAWPATMTPTMQNVFPKTQP